MTLAYEISGELNELMTGKRPLDLLVTKNTHNPNSTKMLLYKNDLIVYEGSNTFSIYPQYGILDKDPTNSVSIDNDEEFKGMAIVDNTLTVFTTRSISTSLLLNDGDGNVTLGSFNTRNNDIGFINTDIFVKTYQDYIYFPFFNDLIVYDATERTSSVYTFDDFILDGELVGQTGGNVKALVSLEHRGLFTTVLSTGKPTISAVELNIPDTYHNDEYLSYINHIRRIGDELYFTQFNGLIYKTTITTDGTPARNRVELVYEITGYVKHILISKDYLTVLNGYDDLYILNLNDGEENLVDLAGTSLDLVSNEIMLAVLFRKDYGGINDISYFSLMDEFPALTLNSTKLIRRAVYDNQGNHTGDYRYYNSLNLMVADSIPSRVSNIDMDVNISFEGMQNQVINFKETNNSKIVYLPITDANGNDIIVDNYIEGTNTPSSLSIGDYSSIFSNIRPSGSSNNFSIINKKNNMEFTNILPRISNDFYNDLTLIDFKDFYYLNGYIYFRSRLLTSNPNTLLTLGYIDSDNKFNGLIYYNKEEDLDLEKELLTTTNKGYLNSLRKLKDESIIDTNITDTNNIVIKALNTDDKPIYKEHNWFRIAFDGSIEDIDDLELIYGVTAYNGSTFTPIGYEDNMRHLSRSYQDKDIRIVNHRKVASANFDGDIQLLEKAYVARVDVGPKDVHISSMSNVSYEKVIPRNAMQITDRNYISNGQTVNGYLSLPIEFDSYQPKNVSLLGEIYIDGKKAFNKYMKQQNTFDGVLNTFYPTEELKPFLSSRDYQRIVDLEVPEVPIQGVLRKRRLVNSEDILASHTINNLYQDEVQMLQTTGIYFNIKIHEYMSSDRFRVFIRDPKAHTFARVNPVRYQVTLDREYGQMLLRIPSASYLKEGMEILIVTNGVTDRTIFYDKLSDLYDIDSVPLMQTANGKYLMMTGMRPEDVDININGYTLIPNVDFSIIDGYDSNGNELALAVFRNILPKNCKLEINFLDEGTYHIRFSPRPAHNTTNIFVLDDEDLVFKDGLFETYANNLRIPREDIEILDSKTIKITTSVTELKNVMFRFSHEPHHNLEDIMNDYKLRFYNNNLGYFHSNQDTVAYDSNFDELCGFNKSTTVNKFILQTFLRDIDLGKFRFIEETKLDANVDNGHQWDINIDGDEINSQYITQNLLIRSNKNYK